MKQDLCKSCGATIYWAVTKNGKAQPFNAEPAEGWLLKKSKGELHVEEKRNVYTPHHQTCPAAAKYRDRGKQKDLFERKQKRERLPSAGI